jgi:hypothetical protein
MRGFLTAALLLALVPLAPVRADVVINEIFYNAPGDQDDLQWLELHNTGAQAADVSGWTIDGGKSFTFPAGTSVAARGYLVVALSPERFQKAYGMAALGPLRRPLKRGGERLELSDAGRKVVDQVKYKDSDPWPVSPDGSSASLERICPTASGETPENWAGSPLPAAAPKAGGTPGQQNATYSAVLPPAVRFVQLAPDEPLAGEPLRVQAVVTDKEAPKAVELQYRIVRNGVEGPDAALPMAREASGDRYHATIPAQPAGVLVRYRIDVTGATGARRRYPAVNDLRPRLTAYVHDPWKTAKVPFGFIFRGGKDRPRAGDAPPAPVFQPRPQPKATVRGKKPAVARKPGARKTVAQAPRVVLPPSAFPGGPFPGGGFPPGGPPGGFGPAGPPQGFVFPPGGPPQGFVMQGGPPQGGFGPGFGGPPREKARPPRGASTLVWVEPDTGKTQVFDYISVGARERGDGERGFRLFFDKDQPLNGMTSVNILFEGSERFLLAEHLAYQVYRRAGNAAPESDFVRLWVDGRMIGYHLLVERPNKTFLRRNGIDDHGNLYKLLWYGNGIVGQHEKKTHTSTGHEDVIALINQLQRTTGDEQWRVIQENFNVDQVATYFAANMVLSHWDGYFNNYFAYHDTRVTKKWEMYPWDQDKTWGYFDVVPDGEFFFTMPLTFGMNGSSPPAGGGNGNPFGQGPPWWRPPGFFSGPLLANPQFRAVFLAKTREILERVYTPEVFFPLIDAAADRLKEDAALRARVAGGSPEAGVHALAVNADALKRHLVKRRQFLLGQAELQAVRSAGSGGPSAR